LPKRHLFSLSIFFFQMWLEWSLICLLLLFFLGQLFKSVSFRSRS
jgi:hypothetical protein